MNRDRDAMTPAERLTALLAAEGVTGRMDPATVADLARAAAAAPPPAPMTDLWLRVDIIRFGEVEPFHWEDFIEVNEDRAGFGEVGGDVFVASDLADGWFHVDVAGRQGLGPGFVFWSERGRWDADDAVPAAESLIELFEAAAAGRTPWKAPMLGDRAVARLLAALDASPAVGAAPPVDPMRLPDPDAPRLPRRLAKVLEAADGFLLPASDRVHWGLSRIAPVAGAVGVAGLPGAFWIGEGPSGLRYATTTAAGWRGLPSERMIAVAPGEDPDAAPVLGRTADVWTRWITEDETR